MSRPGQYTLYNSNLHFTIGHTESQRDFCAFSKVHRLAANPIPSLLSLIFHRNYITIIQSEGRIVTEK